MARKQTEPIKEKFASMRIGRYKSEVKVWQYYSIFNFCRTAGIDREESDRVAKWCRDAASVGSEYITPELSIRIVEKEIPA